MPKISLQEATAELAEHEASICPTCTTYVEEGSEHAPYCFPCGCYWDDCRNGLWITYDFDEETT